MHIPMFLIFISIWYRFNGLMGLINRMCIPLDIWLLLSVPSLVNCDISRIYHKVLIIINHYYDHKLAINYLILHSLTIINHYYSHVLHEFLVTSLRPPGLGYVGSFLSEFSAALEVDVFFCRTWEFSTTIFWGDDMMGENAIYLGFFFGFI